MKLHTISRWNLVIACLCVAIVPAVENQNESEPTLESIANVRVSRSEIQKEMKAKLERSAEPKIQKREPELVEELEASGSDFRPRGQDYEGHSSEVPLSRLPRGIFETLARSLTRNARSPSPQTEETPRPKLRRRTQEMGAINEQSAQGGRRRHRNAQLYSDSYATPGADPISILPSVTSTPVYYQFESREAVPDSVSHRSSHQSVPAFTTSNPFSHGPTIESKSFQTVSGTIGSYGAPQASPSSFPIPNLSHSSQSSSSYSSSNSFRGGSLSNYAAPTQSIWRDQVAPDTFTKGNIHQTSGYEVPPVITNNVGHSSSPGHGIKTGYFPPTQREMPRVNQMEAECSDDVMKLRVKFNATFAGLIYSAGYAYDQDCIYINGTGENEYEFFIQLNRCGTLGGSDHNKKRDVGFKNTEPTKNFMWNTVTIQYNPLIEEEWDEHFKVTCEYGYDFWKTVTFPFLDVEVNTADPVHFTLVPPECHMEIRSGYGTQGARVTGPVHVGDPLTLLINMRSQFDGFDIVVNDCYAHNGANKKIQLIDHHGCPVDEKLISKFQGSWGMDGAMYQTVIYAHMKTFRFTGTPALYIECDIRMCHGRCPTQSCNWRSVRRRRSTGEIDREPRGLEALTNDNDHFFDLEDTEAGLDGEVSGTSPMAPANTTQLSENLRIFQSIHVLQGNEPEANHTQSGADRITLTEDEDNICLRSMVFASVFGTLSLITLMSSVAMSLLCLRMKRLGKSEDHIDYRMSSHGQLSALKSTRSEILPGGIWIDRWHKGSNSGGIPAPSLPKTRIFLGLSFHLWKKKSYYSRVPFSRDPEDKLPLLVEVILNRAGSGDSLGPDDFPTRLHLVHEELLSIVGHHEGREDFQDSSTGFAHHWAQWTGRILRGEDHSIHSQVGFEVDLLNGDSTIGGQLHNDLGPFGPGIVVDLVNLTMTGLQSHEDRRETGQELTLDENGLLSVIASSGELEPHPR
eukprot:maker-scaffold281_size224178-snap-gene-1.32 protein:Tk11002 transcript:maker-scaffold281_size224178-snap-gene-1.32-mRNA-1 annotation:"hypothetical protein TcasGA2_TC010198"